MELSLADQFSLYLIGPHPLSKSNSFCWFPKITEKKFPEIKICAQCISDLLKAIQIRAIPKLQQTIDAVKKSSRDMQYKLELETAKAERSVITNFINKKSRISRIITKTSLTSCSTKIL